MRVKRRGRLGTWVAAAILLASCSGQATVPPGELSGAELTDLVVALADDLDVPADAVPTSPTFETGGSALVTSCYLAVDVLGQAAERPAEVVGAQLDLVAAMAEHEEPEDGLRERLEAIDTALQVDDTPAFGRNGADLLERCAVIVSR